MALVLVEDFLTTSLLDAMYGFLLDLSENPRKRNMRLRKKAIYKAPQNRDIL